MYQFKLVGQIAVFNVRECKLIGLEATSLCCISLNAALSFPLICQLHFSWLDHMV